MRIKGMGKGYLGLLQCISLVAAIGKALKEVTHELRRVAIGDLPKGRHDGAGPG